MKSSFIRNIGSVTWIGLVAGTLLFTQAATADGQQQKEQKERERTAGQAPQQQTPAAQRQSAPPQRQMPPAVQRQEAPPSRQASPPSGVREPRRAQTPETRPIPAQQQQTAQPTRTPTGTAGERQSQPGGTPGRMPQPAAIPSQQGQRPQPGTIPGREGTPQPGVIPGQQGKVPQPAAIPGREGRSQPGGIPGQQARGIPSQQPRHVPGFTGRIPSGEVNRRSDGSYTVDAKGRGKYSVRPDGSLRTFGSDRGQAEFRPDGSLRTIHAKDMTIFRDPLGGRRVLAKRPDRSEIFSEGGGHGYIQRPFSYRGHEFERREYYGEHGHFARFYEPYRFRGFALNIFLPGRYYPPVFYGWAFGAWPAPVYFRWGWLGAPWYPYYGPYFAPFPYYGSASLWLTDYLLAAVLEEDYRNRAAAASNEAVGFVPPCDASQARVNDETKQAIAREVRYQLSLMSAESQIVANNGIPDPAATGLPRLLTDNNPHAFVVSKNLDVETRAGECWLTPGDVLLLNAPPPAASEVAYLQVLANKSNDCPSGSVVAVSFEDLQEMQNYTRSVLDQGLAELRAKQGQGGLPAAPAAALGGVIQSSFAAAAPPPDPNAADLLNQVEQTSGATENSVLGQAFEPSAETSEPATIRLGQTVDDVVAILGKPEQVVDLGVKKIYVYRNMKVTFTGGRVTDVQ